MEYIKSLFTKPEIELSAIDKLAMSGIIISLLIIFVILLFSSIFVISSLKEKNSKK